MNSNLDEFHRPLRADFLVDAGDAQSSAPCTALVSTTHAGRDPRTFQHEHTTTNGSEPVNTDSLDDAGCDFPVLHMLIESLTHCVVNAVLSGVRCEFVSLVLHFLFHR
jgi:hypothetical protein